MKHLPAREGWKEDFGDDARYEVHEVSGTDCEHYLTRLSGEAQCVNCGWGFRLDAHDQIRDGQLYRDGKRIVF